MAHGTESAMRKVHYPALKRSDAPKIGGNGPRAGQVNVTGYIRQWNRNCPKGQELSDGQRRTLQRWLNGGLGANFKHSQTKNAKRNRRCRNRQKENKKTVVKTTATFSMD